MNFNVIFTTINIIFYWFLIIQRNIKSRYIISFNESDNNEFKAVACRGFCHENFDTPCQGG